MPRLAILVALTALLLPAADKPKKGKQPDIEMIELRVRRVEGQVTVDGKLRNTGEKKLEGVLVILDFFAPSKVPITTQKTNVDDEAMDPGQESGFRAVMVDPVRAVECVFSAAEDRKGKDLRLAKVLRVPIE